MMALRRLVFPAPLAPTRATGAPHRGHGQIQAEQGLGRTVVHREILDLQQGRHCGGHGIFLYQEREEKGTRKRDKSRMEKAEVGKKGPMGRGQENREQDFSRDMGVVRAARGPGYGCPAGIRPGRGRVSVIMVLMVSQPTRKGFLVIFRWSLSPSMM